jgi:hypothetical protein
MYRSLQIMVAPDKYTESITFKNTTICTTLQSSETGMSRVTQQELHLVLL